VPTLGYQLLERVVDIESHARGIRARGYTIIPRQVRSELLDALNAAADRAIAAVDAAMAAGLKPAHTEISPYYRAARCFYSWDRSCRELLLHDTVNQLGDTILRDPRLWDMTVLEAKPLPVGADLGPFDWHRDFQIDETGQSFLWVFTCLTDVTAENGATWVIPGSHRDKSIETPKHGAVSANRPSSAIQLTARRGDIIAINPAMLHAVGENRTQSGRRLALVGLCRDDRSPLLNHHAIAAPLLHDEPSPRLAQLVRRHAAKLNNSWDVMPDGWPIARDGARLPDVRRLWARLRGAH
jgi:ectoine hydroxylase-related dioxygenase (phytanoyl-CoA dioxygenase family)